MQLRTKAGLTLIALALGIFAAWNLWAKTRNLAPVNVPISLAAGQSVWSEFKLNFDAVYLIEIEAEKTIPLDTLRCLMGIEADAGLCKDTPTAIGANWILSSQSQELRRGSSAELHTAPVQANGVARVIGEFQGKAGQEYRLQITFTADGGALAASQPRLKVGVASIAYTDLQSAGVLVFSTIFIFALFGVVLLAISAFARGGKTREEHGRFV
jgi:hypothetical protein